MNTEKKITVWTVRYDGNANQYKNTEDDIYALTPRDAVITWMIKYRDEHFFPDKKVAGMYRDQNGEVIMHPDESVCSHDGGVFYAEPYED